MKKVYLLGLLFLPALVFSRELKVSVFDGDLEFPLEGAALSLQGSTSSVYSDENGEAVFDVPDDVDSGIITAVLPGYAKSSVEFSSGDVFINVYLSMADVIEGEELIVKRTASRSGGEKTGVSTVISREEMQTTANVGIIEDCMSSVRTLPGVSYSGAWGSKPSVRGGEPKETSCLLDGMYTIFPWHWGGGASIFNPSIVDSIKLSNGVFSARYGRASSGLLEAETLKPDYEKFHVNASLSTTCADLFAQVPFGKNTGGMILGSHLTYLDPLCMAVKATGSDLLDSVERAPYIRDAFIKTSLTPYPELDISIIGFFGSDGIGIDLSEEDKGITTAAKLDYDIYQALGGLNVKYLVTDSFFLQGLLSYNGIYEDLEQKITENGNVLYNQDFIEKYSSKYSGVYSGAGYELDNLETNLAERINSHLVSGKFEGEIQFSDMNQLCFGVEETFSTATTKEKVNGWSDIETSDGTFFKNISFSTDSKGNCILDNAVYLSWVHGNESSLIESEVGVRGEFINLWNKKDDYTLNFIPDICPRASVTFTPLRNTSCFERVSFNAGSGIFVSIPMETMMFTKEMGLKNFDVHTNRALLGVIGAEAVFNGGWSVKLESYYRHYLSRIYTYSTVDAASNWEDISLFAKSNGQGHVFGLDFMLEKKREGMWDGYCSYSFVYARLKNPAGISGDESIEAGSDTELDKWFYPAYHRFHTVNLVSNWHFKNNWTLTVKGTLATGTPKEKSGGVTCYAAEMDDGTVIQRYTRSSFYSDTLRTQISCPVDLRIAKNWVSEDNKKSCEFYFALQDVFVNLYSPKDGKSFNSYTGEVSEVEDSADFNIGIPIPSLGFKMNF
ncbi:TonB-dependent receptor [Treponema sp.]|uniref:TonB-dependent receptor plug domain-containing protein n=1 Tax=Treponema sp. TaxID=166 RepID=UPI00257AC518|nr:TonB-dependent receptor [Treponema sp.]MBE6353628.1 hypothetical protein [Treponema sp.]